MDGQLSLFGAFDTAERSLARKTDPRSSHEAVPSSAQLSEIKQLILSNTGKHPGTANEIAERCARDPRNVKGTRAETFRKRVKELVDDGHRVVSGELLCVITGKVVTGYRRA